MAEMCRNLFRPCRLMDDGSGMSKALKEDQFCDEAAAENNDGEITG